MRIDVLTLFPEIFPGPLGSSIVGRALRKGIFELNAVNLRDFARDERGTVDERPYGGGAGMLMKPEILADALKNLKSGGRTENGGCAETVCEKNGCENGGCENGGCAETVCEKNGCKNGGCAETVCEKNGCENGGGNAGNEKVSVILTSPRGRRFDQRMAEDFAARLRRGERLVLVCGHYEGVDQRWIDHYVDEEVSLGDFVLTSGNLAAMVIIDAVSRLLPGVLGKTESGEDESFSTGLLEYPQYTRPEVFEGEAVPEVLLAGDHGKVDAWRQAKAEELTRDRRPDLWIKYLTDVNKISEEKNECSGQDSE